MLGAATIEVPMPFQEVVEAEGHLIDSHIMENIFDKVVEYHGRFEVEQFRIGKTNSEPSYLRLKVETPDGQDARPAAARTAESGMRAGGFERCRSWPRWSATGARRRISTPPPTTRRTCATGSNGSRWRISAWTRWWWCGTGARTAGVCAICRPATPSWSGMRGIRVTPESKERDRLSFAFMANSISSERQVETAVRQTAALVRHAVEQKQKVLVVAGPVVVHTGGAAGLASLIRGGWVHGVLSGNALGRARYRSGAARHVAGRAALRRAAGRARASQSHARHQRHLSRGIGARRRWRAGGCARGFSTSA